MRLVFAGTPETAVPSLAALHESRHDVVAVVTRPDARAGRGRRLEASPVKRYAHDHGIPVLTPDRTGAPDFLEALRDLRPEVCPVVAYGKILPKSTLAVPVHGWVNLHFSVLPAWRGAAPVQHAVMAGDEITGACTFLVEPDLDSGPIYGTLTERIGPTDTSGELLDRLSRSGASLLLATIDAIADGTAVAVPQPIEGISYAAKIEARDARIAWELPAHIVDRRIRGCTPEPGAWTIFRGERLKVGPIRLAGDTLPMGAALAPGELLGTKSAVYVGTAGQPVRLGMVVPLGRRDMAAPDWARGVRIVPGERLGDDDR